MLSPPYFPNVVGRTKIAVAANMLTAFARQNQLACLTWRTFVDSVTIPGKKRIYERALGNLLDGGYQKWMSRLSSFIKVEAVCGTTKGSADPRMIQARSPEFNIVFGCYYKPIEHLLLTLDWSRVFPWAPKGRLIAKGLNNVQRGRLLRAKWETFKNPICFDFDASRFDQSVSVEFLEMCHEFYVALHNGDKFLAKILREQIKNAGVTANGWRYFGDGGRASGDQDTGGGNSLITVVMAIQFFRFLSIRFDFICDGDDGLLFIEAEDIAVMSEFVQHCMDMGFKMELGKPVSVFEHIDFCQCRPVELMPGKWVMVRKPARAISRLAMSHTSMSTIIEALYTLWAVGSCELALGSGVPIMQSVALWAIRNGKKPSARFMALTQYRATYRYWDLPKSHGPRPISPCARESFSEAFGVSVGEQLILERAFDSHVVDLQGRKVLLEVYDTGAGPVISDDYSVYLR